jgi:hypothetical protein
MKAAGLALVIFGILLGFGALLFFTRLMRGVAGRAPSRRAAPVSRLLEVGNPARIWREHRRHFPYSSERRATVVLATAAIVCISAGLFLAK